MGEAHPYASNKETVTPVGPVVPCPFEGKHPKLVVMVQTPPGLLPEDLQVRISNESGFSKAVKPEKGADNVSFAELADGFYTIDVIFPDPPKRAADAPPVQHYTANPVRVEITKPSAQLVRALSDAAPVLTIKSERTRAFLEGRTKKAGPIEFQLSAVAKPVKFDGIALTVTVTGAEVRLFQDADCETPLALTSGKATLSDTQKGVIKSGRPLTLWAVPQSPDAFTITFGSHAAGITAVTRSFLAATEFLEGTSKFLQLIDAFETVDEIRSSVPRVRSLAALVDMKADELANFAIKRLVIRKGVLEQQVKVCINPPHPAVAENTWKDAKPVARAGYVSHGVGLEHPDVPGHPLLYSDFIVDRSGPKFLGALDADVAVEVLMYKDACITTILHREDAKRAHLPADQRPFMSSVGCDLIDNVCKLARDRFDTLKGLRDNDGKYAPLTDAEIEKAVSVYQQKHMAQRRLSDFDLTARETDTFSRAIYQKLCSIAGGLTKPQQAKVKPELIQAIGWQCWSRGGPIETDKIVAILDAPDQAKAYFASVAADPLYFAGAGHSKMEYAETNKPFYHLLIREIGPEIIKMLPDAETRVDNFYGLGIPFYGPEVYEDGNTLAYHTEAQPPHGKDLKKDGYKEEIGDIINDETSHYGKILSHNANVQLAIKNLGIDVGSFVSTKNYRENLEAQLAGKSAAEVKRYKDRAAFIDTMMMFEQISKKEAQSQLYKRDLIAAQGKKDQKAIDKHAGKLMGNVSDVSQFLFGVDIAQRVAAAKTPPDTETGKLMQALKETTMLSCCIAMPRWGITKANVAEVKDTAATKLFTTETFANSINERSYGHFASSHIDAYAAPRVQVEWAKIDTAIAQQRLNDFTTGMKPVWNFLHAQPEFFGAMDKLIAAIGSNKADRTAELKAVSDAFDQHVLPAVPELVKMIGGPKKTLLAALTEQAEESAAFQVARDRKASGG